MTTVRGFVPPLTTLPEQFYYSEMAPMEAPALPDRRALAILLRELVGRQPLGDDLRDALKWVQFNVRAMVPDDAPRRRRYLMALRRASEGRELTFYDEQILGDIESRLRAWFGNTVFEDEN
jgi:hypothetical protein